MRALARQGHRMRQSDLPLPLISLPLLLPFPPPSPPPPPPSPHGHHHHGHPAHTPWTLPHSAPDGQSAGVLLQSARVLLSAASAPRRPVPWPPRVRSCGNRSRGNSPPLPLQLRFASTTRRLAHPSRLARRATRLLPVLVVDAMRRSSPALPVPAVKSTSGPVDRPSHQHYPLPTARSSPITNR